MPAFSICTKKSYNNCYNFLFPTILKSALVLFIDRMVLMNCLLCGKSITPFLLCVKTRFNGIFMKKPLTYLSFIYIIGYLE